MTPAAAVSEFQPARSRRKENQENGFSAEFLGVMEYAEALRLQHDLVDKRVRGIIPDTLLLLEHPPVVTLGRGYNGRTLGATPHPVRDTDRGGDITYHGPGQLVGYPIVHLLERGLRIGPYLRLIEGALIDTAVSFGVCAERLKGFTGVWVGGRKLASIGIAAKAWISYHGFALNVSTDPTQFSGIHPCGLEPEQMTSLERLLGVRCPSTAAVRSRVIEAFRDRLSTGRTE